MNPTVLNVIIALLSVGLGWLLNDIYNHFRYWHTVPKGHSNAGVSIDEFIAHKGAAYQEGFEDGYNASETEDEVDEAFFATEEQTGVDLSKPGTYITPSQLKIIKT